jgi:hypothetical protein
MAPVKTPGPKPVMDAPGDEPMSPVRTELPVLVTVDDARAA